MAQSSAAADNLMRMIRFNASYDIRAKGFPQFDNKTEFLYEDNSGALKASADEPDATRSATNQFVLATEHPSWKAPEEQMKGLLQTVPTYRNMFFVIESTGKSETQFQDIFYEGWNAERDRAHFTKEDEAFYARRWHSIFLSWRDSPDRYWKEIRGNREKFIAGFNEEEKRLFEDGTPAEQLNWRRDKITTMPGFNYETKLRNFKQEFPATPEEAFSGLDADFFDHGAIKFHRDFIKENPNLARPAFVGEVLYDKTGIEWDKFGADYGYFIDTQLNEGAFKENRGYELGLVKGGMGRFQLWKYPNAFEDSVIGCDVAEGKMNKKKVGDDSAFYVRDMEGNYVAGWCGKIKPEDLASLLACIGFMYNTAYIQVENNGPGNTTLTYLRKIYPEHRLYKRMTGQNLDEDLPGDELGFQTNAQITKPLVMFRADYVLRNFKNKIYDPELLSELNGATREKNGTVDTTGKDRLMAYVMTEWAAVDHGRRWPLGFANQPHEMTPAEKEEAILKELFANRRKNDLPNGEFRIPVYY